MTNFKLAANEGVEIGIGVPKETKTKASTAVTEDCELTRTFSDIFIECLDQLESMLGCMTRNGTTHLDPERL